MTVNRFVLKSWHFMDNKGVLYDRLEGREFHVDVFGFVDLLNDVARVDFDRQVRKEKILKEIKEFLEND